MGFNHHIRHTVFPQPKVACGCCLLDMIHFQVLFDQLLHCCTPWHHSSMHYLQDCIKFQLQEGHKQLTFQNKFQIVPWSIVHVWLIPLGKYFISLPNLHLHKGHLLSSYDVSSSIRKCLQSFMTLWFHTYYNWWVFHMMTSQLLIMSSKNITGEMIK